MKRIILLYTVLILTLACNQTSVHTGEKKHSIKLDISRKIPVQKIDSVNIHYVEFEICTITNLKCNELDSGYKESYFFRHITNKDTIKDIFAFLDKAELTERNIKINDIDARVKLLIYARGNKTDSLCVSFAGQIIYKTNMYSRPGSNKYRVDGVTTKYFKNLVGDK